MNESLEKRITEILLRTQFREWVDHTPRTAHEAETQDTRALTFYLGIGRLAEGDSERSIVANHFRAVVNMQTALIMRAIEKAAT